MRAVGYGPKRDKIDRVRSGLLMILCLATVGAADAAPSLSGPWLFGAYQPEPKEAVVSIPQRCWQGGVDFTLIERGKKLAGTVHWIEAASGVPRPPRDETETLIGTHDGNHIILTGKHQVVTSASPYPAMPGEPPDAPETSVKYDLRFAPKTGHLVGTRDGKPFWLARFKTTHADCGSPPP